MATLKFKPGDLYHWRDDGHDKGFYFIVGTHEVGGHPFIPAASWCNDDVINQWTIHRHGRVISNYGQMRKVKGEEADRVQAAFVAAQLLDSVERIGW